MYRANLAGNKKRTKNRPKSSNIANYSYAHHSDSYRAFKLNVVFVTEGLLVFADFVSAQTDIDRATSTYIGGKVSYFWCLSPFLFLCTGRLTVIPKRTCGEKNFDCDTLVSTYLKKGHLAIWYLHDIKEVPCTFLIIQS